MKTALKLTAAAALAAGLLSVGTAASAAECAPAFFLNAWPTEGCTTGDKLWKFISSDLPNQGNTEVEIEIPLTGVYKITIDPTTSLTQGTWTFKYTVEVTDASRWLTSVRIDSDLVEGDAEVKKEIFYDEFVGSPDATISSVNGSPGGPVSFSGQPQKLWILETIDVKAGGVLSSFTDTYRQDNAQVPEPGMLALLGLGLAGLAATRRRKQ